MIECEGKELGREIDSYLRQSLAELKRIANDRLNMYRRADESLQAMVDALPEREQQAILCMLGRDLDLVMELYCEFLRTFQNEVPVRLADPPAPPLPFSEWLFAR
jgi:hypothetical protein